MTITKGRTEKGHANLGSIDVIGVPNKTYSLGMTNLLKLR